MWWKVGKGFQESLQVFTKVYNCLLVSKTFPNKILKISEKMFRKCLKSDFLGGEGSKNVYLNNEIPHGKLTFDI